MSVARVRTYVCYKNVNTYKPTQQVQGMLKSVHRA